MNYGYIRVSTKEQNEDRQLIALKQCDIAIDKIYMDKQSGMDFNRTEYRLLIKELKKGDVLVIKSIDRLGRNYNEILEQWRKITKIKNADIVVLDMPILDTTQHKDLLGTLISDLVLQLLSYVAESERVNIRQRQAEGIAAAKAKGIRFGRPKKFIADEYTDVFIQYRQREISREQAIKTIGCGKNTFYRLLDELRKKGRIL